MGWFYDPDRPDNGDSVWSAVSAPPTTRPATAREIEARSSWLSKETLAEVVSGFPGFEKETLTRIQAGESFAWPYDPITALGSYRVPVHLKGAFQRARAPYLALYARVGAELEARRAAAEKEAAARREAECQRAVADYAKKSEIRVAQAMVVCGCVNRDRVWVAAHARAPRRTWIDIPGGWELGTNLVVTLDGHGRVREVRVV